MVKDDLWFRPAELPDSFNAYCPGCRKPADFELVAPRVHFEDWGRGRHFEDLAPEGKTFTSKHEYERHLKENGLSEWRPSVGMPHCEV